MIITKFLNYISESKEINKDDLDEYLLDIKELGIHCDYREGGIITDHKDEFVGREYRYVVFSMIDMNKTGIGMHSGVISDSNIWNFLEELLVFKNRLESDKVYIKFHNNEYIYVYFLTSEKKSGNELELIKLYTDIRKRSLSGRSDFHNSMLISLKDNMILISSDYYTDRKLNLFLRGIDLSEFNIEKIQLRDGKCNITITHK